MAGIMATVYGRVHREPEIRVIKGGSGDFNSTEATIVVKHRDTPGGSINTFVKVVAFGKLGETIMQSAREGAEALAMGKMETRLYKTKDGESRTSIELRATHFEITSYHGTGPAQSSPREDDDVAF